MAYNHVSLSGPTRQSVNTVAIYSVPPVQILYERQRHSSQLRSGARLHMTRPHMLSLVYQGVLPQVVFFCFTACCCHLPTPTKFRLHRALSCNARPCAAAPAALPTPDPRILLSASCQALLELEALHLSFDASVADHLWHPETQRSGADIYPHGLPCSGSLPPCRGPQAGQNDGMKDVPPGLD